MSKKPGNMLEFYGNPLEQQPTRKIKLRPGDNAIKIIEDEWGILEGLIITMNGKPIPGGPAKFRYEGGVVRVYTPPGFIGRLFKKLFKSTIGRIVGVLLVAAGGMVLGPMLAASMGFAAGGFASAFITGALVAGGLMLFNALLPPMQPEVGDYEPTQFKPTYSLLSQANKNDKFSPFPVVFGRIKVFPVVASNFYAEAGGDKQHLRLLYCIGANSKEFDLKISDLKVGTEPMAAVFARENLNEWGQKKGEPAADPAAGQAVLYGSDSEIMRAWITPRWQGGEIPGYPSAVEVNRRRTRFAKTPGAGDKGSYTPLSATIKYYGGEVNVLMHFPSGLYAVEKDEGKKVSLNFFVRFEVSPTFNAAQTAKTQSVGVKSPNKYGFFKAFELAADMFPAGNGEYTIEITPSYHPHWDTKADIVELVEITSTAPGQLPIIHERAGDLALLAMRVLASESYSGGLSRVSVLVEARGIAKAFNDALIRAELAPVSELSYRNPAACLYVALTSPAVNITPLDDKFINFGRLRQWAEFCEKEGFAFDYMVENSITLSGLLQLICSAGQANLDFWAGKWAVLLDSPEHRHACTQVFTPFNADNFEYMSGFHPNSPKSIRVLFLDEENDYEPGEMILPNPYASSTGNGPTYEEIRLSGVVKRAAAEKLINYRIWKNSTRRQAITFTTHQALACRRGDKIRVATPELTPGLDIGKGWISKVGTIERRPSKSNRLKQYHLLTIKTAGQYPTHGSKLGALRLPDGEVIERVNFNVAEDEITAAWRLVSTLNVKVDDEVIFTLNAKVAGKEFVITKIEPVDDFGARITAIEEKDDKAPKLYAGVPVKAFVPAIDLSPPEFVSVQSDESVLVRGADGSFTPRVVFELAPPAANFDKVAIQWQWRVAGEEWGKVETLLAAQVSGSFVAAEGEDVEIRVRLLPISGGLAGAWRTTDHKVIGKTGFPPDATSLKLINRGDGIDLEITATPPLDFAGFVVKYEWKGEVDFSKAPNFGVDEWDAAWQLGRLSFPAGGSGEQVYRHNWQPQDSGAFTIGVRTMDTGGRLSRGMITAKTTFNRPNLGQLIFSLSENNWRRVSANKALISQGKCWSEAHNFSGNRDVSIQHFWWGHQTHIVFLPASDRVRNFRRSVIVKFGKVRPSRLIVRLKAPLFFVANRNMGVVLGTFIEGGKYVRYGRVQRHLASGNGVVDMVYDRAELVQAGYGTLWNIYHIDLVHHGKYFRRTPPRRSYLDDCQIILESEITSIRLEVVVRSHTNEAAFSYAEAGFIAPPFARGQMVSGSPTPTTSVFFKHLTRTDGVLYLLDVKEDELTAPDNGVARILVQLEGQV